MSTARLVITDGTTEIDLLNMAGFLLESWRPSIPFYKGGGTFQQSPLSIGRNLVNKQFENYTDTFSFKLKDVDTNSAIRRIQDIRRLLETASSYWVTDWQDAPVWIEAKAKCETNIRYSLIITGYIPDDENPYSQPFLQASAETVMDNMTLIIEHQAWTENQPGTGTAVALSADEIYDGRNLGNVDSTGTKDPTSSNEVYLATKRNVANITDIYVDDGGALGPNLMDALLPFSLLPAIPVVNDAIYFGIDTTLTDSGPFCSLVFDIGIAGVGYDGIWEYWNGAWVAISVVTSLRDNTDQAGAMTGAPFDTAGVGSVHWKQASDWITTTVGAITGYWVRFRVTSVPGPLTVPTQQNRNIYSVIWPYAELESTEIQGDIPALCRLKIYGQSVNTFNELWAYRVIIGSRSYARGSNFTAYINLADEQNPSGFTLSVGSGATFATSVLSPTGRVVSANVNVAVFSPFAVIQMDDTISSDYYGEYHLFLRGYQTGGTPGSIELRVTANTSLSTTTPVWYISEVQSFTTIGLVQLLDMGKLVIGPTSGVPISDSWELLVFRVEGNGGGAGESITMYDMILIPVDEWAGDFSLLIEGALTADEVIDTDQFLDIDSISVPKAFLLPLRRLIASSNIDASVISISNNLLNMQANQQQRIWFLTDGIDTASSDVQSNIETVHSIQLIKQSQYQSMRGDR